MTTLCQSLNKIEEPPDRMRIPVAGRQAFVAMWGLNSSRQKGCGFIVFVTVAEHFCKAEFFKSMTFIS